MARLWELAEMEVFDTAVELAAPPERWYVDLTSGESLELLTHGYSTEDGRLVFSLLFKGHPNFFVTVLSLPEHLVAGIRD